MKLKDFVRHITTQEIGFVYYIDKETNVISVQLPYLYDDTKPYEEARDAALVNQIAGFERDFELVTLT